VENQPAPKGTRNVNIEINTVKIGEDIHRGSEKLQDLLNKELRERDAKDKEAEKRKSLAGKEGRAGPHDDGGAELSEHR
jgi:hypothetical protein